jgi:heme/copper-type cytochrome/quinol oxidase subunit 3
MNQISVSATKKEEAAAEATAVAWWSPKRLLSDGANVWGVSQRTMILIMMVPFLVLAAGVVSGLLGKEAYKWFTGEDRFAENLQVVLWVTSFILTVFVAKMKFQQGDKVMAGLYVVLCVGLFFIIGEEVSWGQRIFGWSTPESMKVINKQDETNIHNIHGVGTTFKWLHLLVGAYGTFLPLILMRSKKLARFRDELSMLVPHYTLIPFFAIPFVWRFYRNVFEAPKDYYFAISEFSEVVEVVLAFGFLFFLLYQMRRLRPQKALIGDPNNGAVV